MYNRILISTDGSEVAQRGVDHGLALAKGLGVAVTIITVSEPFPVYSSGVGYDLLWNSTASDEYSDAQRVATDAMLQNAKRSAERVGVSADTVHVPNAQVSEAIIAYAREHNCDLIVMSSHGRRGLNRLILGSNTSEVLSHSDIPVLVVR